MKKLLLTTASVAVFAATANAATIHVFAGDPALDLSAPATVGDKGITWGTESLTGITGTADGVDFTYNLTFSSNASLNGDILADEGGADFTDGESYSLIVTITSQTGGTVSFDGLTNFSTSNTAGGEGVTVGGVTYLRGTATNGDSDPRNGVIITGGIVAPTGVGSDTITFTSVNTTRLEAAAFQFTGTAAVPEPSSTALLGLGGLALILRRRK